jgi:hypothetical protein
MSDSRELFEKAEALLGRYRGEPEPERAAPGDPASEADYPVLTEIIEPGQGPAFATSEPADAALCEEPPAAASALTGEQLREIELRVLERIEMALQPLVEAAFRQALSEQFEEQLRWMLHEFSEQAKADVEAQLRERLSEAVHLSMESLRAAPE